ncbi:MAG: alpha/beta hydrolase [Candidatus Nanopelagicales bacterium]
MHTEFRLTAANRALRRLLAMPERAIERVAGPPPQIDGRTVDPAVNLILRSLERVDLTGSEAHDIAKRRAGMARSTRMVMPEAQGISVSERLIPGPESALPVRVYRDHRTIGPAPVIIYYHGGGWVVGDLRTHDGTCRMLARHSGCVVVSVHYRRAPEHPFPAPLDDAVAAFRYVHDHPGEFSGIPGAVAVMGDSAGGNLAAAVCLQTRNDGPSPVAQSLVYPATDLRMTSPSVDTFGEGFMLTKADMRWYRSHYLPDPAIVDDPRASPLLAKDLSGLPPALIWTAGFDPLRDEGMAYARRLREAGGRAGHVCLDDQIHGFLGMGVLPGGMERIERVCAQTGALVRTALS